jgi:hypothetical protein
LEFKIKFFSLPLPLSLEYLTSNHKKLIKMNNNNQENKKITYINDNTKNERKKKQVHILVSIFWNLIR